MSGQTYISYTEIFFKGFYIYMNIITGDIHTVIKTIPSGSIDFIYNDPPFATTANEWDKPLDWDLLFKECWRVLKPTGVIALHCSMPFTYELIRNQTPKYHYIWIKDKPTNFFHAKKQPLRQQEEILIFYKKQPTYNPQMIGDTFYKTGKAGKSSYYGSRGEEKQAETGHYGKYPTNILTYTRHIRGASTRPDALVDFFIHTYSNEGDTILDLTCYNGLTGNRCAELNRKYIGVDLDPQL